MPLIKHDQTSISNISRPARDLMLVEVLITFQSPLDSGYLRFSFESIVLP
jgi:hypothetical protein